MTYLSTALSNLSQLAAAPERYTIKEGELVVRDSNFCCCFGRGKETAEEGQKRARFLSQNVMMLNSCNRDDLIDHTTELRELFFNSMTLSQYNRREISLQGRLEFALDPDVGASHEEDDTIDPVSGKRIHETLMETRFSLRLGVPPEPAESPFHIVYYLLSRFDERLGVFKPRVLTDEYYGTTETFECHLSEAAACLLDRRLGLGLVPHTEVFTSRFPTLAQTPLTGSYQLYVPDAPRLYDLLEGEDLFAEHDILQRSLNTSGNRALKFQNFEKVALLDMVLGNQDRHFKNILFSPTGEKKGSLVLIDNKHSFPWCHLQDVPPYKRAPFNPFKWRALPQANRAFSSKMSRRIRRMNPDQVTEVIQRVFLDPANPSSMEYFDGKITTFGKRLQEIQRLAQQHAPIADIARTLMELSDEPPQPELPDEWSFYTETT